MLGLFWISRLYRREQTLVIIGVAGPMQSGKHETRGVFEEAGFTFLDLDNSAQRARIEDPEVVKCYHRLGLSETLTAGGERTARYYQRLLNFPGIHQAVMAVELPLVALRTRDQLARQARQNLVISWGYLHLILNWLPKISHVFLLQSEDRVWFERLRRQARRLGVPAYVELSDDVLRRLIAANGLGPPVVESVIKAQQVPYTLVDTSGDDWGVANLQRALATLRGSAA